MSGKTDEINDAAAVKVEPKRKKSSRLVLVILLLVLMVAGWAVSFYFLSLYSLKPVAEAQEVGKKEDFVEVNGGDGEGAAGGEGAKRTPLVLPRDEDVKSVLEIQPFILNLADKEDNRFLRLTLSLGISDNGSERPNSLFITRVRNAILTVLMTKTSADVLSPEGKLALRKELLQAVRTVAKEPRVSAIYITELIVQR